MEKIFHRCGKNFPLNNISNNNILEDEEEDYYYDDKMGESNKGARVCTQVDKSNNNITNKELDQKLEIFDEIKESIEVIKEDAAPGFDCIKDSEALFPSLQFFASELVYRDTCKINGLSVNCTEILQCLSSALKNFREKEVLDVFRDVSKMVREGTVKNHFAFLAANLFTRLKLTVN